MLIFIVYLLGVLPVIDVLAGLAAACCGFFYLIRKAITTFGNSRDLEKLADSLERTKYAGAVFGLTLLLAIVVPSQKTAYNMLAAYGVTEVYESLSQSQEVRDATSKAMQVLDKAMDDFLTQQN